jgi:2-keto-4-pentenoate hydratase/2-oxohepta-3-ene-1,7-dioic acid hydratase in catechol pathway
MSLISDAKVGRRRGHDCIFRSMDSWLPNLPLVPPLCPMGPYAVSADEVPDVTALLVESRVNGEPRQAAQVKDLIFDLPELIATISSGITLLPGDVIATGTPAGVGIGFDPPRFLSADDVVEVSITRLGTQRNRIV